MSDSSSFAELFEGMEGFLADDDSPTIAGGGADREQSQIFEELLFGVSCGDSDIFPTETSDTTVESCVWPQLLQHLQPPCGNQCAHLLPAASERRVRSRHVVGQCVYPADAIDGCRSFKPGLKYSVKQATQGVHTTSMRVQLECSFMHPQPLESRNTRCLEASENFASTQGVIEPFKSIECGLGNGFGEVSAKHTTIGLTCCETVANGYARFIDN